MRPSIAIVIPAYKGRFLDRTLQSIAGQDDSDFAVYVGDDCSPEDLGSVVKSFEGRLKIIYRRFAENLGGENLLSHWERCLDMVKEDYILFFSDDDILPSDAVSRIRKAIADNPGREFFRFGLKVIDENDAVVMFNPDFISGSTTAEQMLADKLSGRTSSAAVEYVFSSDLYRKIGGRFVHFPVAWCSDDATWYLMAREKGVVNIYGEPVGWRNVTGGNISNSSRYNREKMQATLMFLSWLKENWRGPADREFISTLKEYVKTILYISLEKDFTFEDSRRMFRVLSLFSYRLAFYIFMKMNIILFRNN